MVGVRRKARIIALQALYEFDSVRHETDEVLARLLKDAGLADEQAAFARELVSGVIQNKERIDRDIQDLASAWPVEQIPIVDRNIIRLQSSRFCLIIKCQ